MKLEMKTKPDFEKAMQRVDAWYEGAVLDRPPVRFTAHNSFVRNSGDNRKWGSIKDKWFDADYQIEAFIHSLEDKSFLGETFPVYWPNLGPGVYSAFYGAELEFEKTTSWVKHNVRDWADLAKLKFDEHNLYLKKIEELTDLALQQCSGRFLVGYTDLHPGMDCVAAWRGSEELCVDLLDEPARVKEALALSVRDFKAIYDRFDETLKRNGQMSVTWMEIPSSGRMHIPSCDFSTMISEQDFIEFCLPSIKTEMASMTHNIFHLDGKGVARHLDAILALDEVQAIQWVQGVGTDQPIMQWLPLIRKIRAHGKSLVIDLQLHELDAFTSAIGPEGIFLCLPVADSEAQKAVLEKLKTWK